MGKYTGRRIRGKISNLIWTVIITAGMICIAIFLLKYFLIWLNVFGETVK